MHQHAKRACVGAIMKLEAPFIVEWVAWYRILGFDIVIADHGGDDGQSDLLAKLDAIGLIRRIDVRGLRGKVQEKVYQALFRWAARNNYDYIGFLDADEFFEPMSIQDGDWRGSGALLIEKLFAGTSYPVLCFNWMVFGDGKGAPAGSEPVTSRFQWSAAEEFSPNCHVKSFCHVASCEKMFPVFVHEEKAIGVHRPNLPERYLCHDGKTFENGVNSSHTRELSWVEARIRHYVTKSEQEFREKKARRGDWSNYSKQFFEYHNRNDVFSPLPERVQELIRAEMAVIAGQLAKAPTVTIRPPSVGTALAELQWQTRPYIKGYIYSVARRWRRAYDKLMGRTKTGATP